MKPTLVLLLGILTYVCCQSQTAFDGLEILETIIQQKQDTNKVYYADSMLNHYRYPERRKLLRKREHSSILKPVEKTSIALSRKEQQYLLKRLGKIKDSTWPDHLFRSAEKIPFDSVWSTLRKIQLWGRPMNFKGIKRIWELMPPILFRDNNCALVFTLNFCGGECGNEDLSFY